mgnify:CR=1 FL=1
MVLRTLRHMRREAGLSIYDMALMLGISPSYYSLIESGRRGLSLRLATRIAGVLGRPVEVVFPCGEVDSEHTRSPSPGGR